MTADIETVHHDDGITRTVVLTDATGTEHRYPFEETEDGHEYVGEGEPTERAREAIEAFEAAESMAEFEQLVEEA